jgi:hypothetical protein
MKETVESAPQAATTHPLMEGALSELFEIVKHALERDATHCVVSQDVVQLGEGSTE